MFLFRACFKKAETVDNVDDTNGIAAVASEVRTRKKMTLEDLNFIRVLGKGSYGKVMLAEKRDTEALYAVKVIRKDALVKDTMTEYAFREKTAMIQMAGNPFFTSLHSCFQTATRLVYVMDFQIGGNLLYHLHRCTRFDEPRAAFYAAEITVGLQFLHRNAIIYRDLKLSNVLLDRFGHCKLSDFGLCKERIKTAFLFRIIHQK